MPAFVQAGAGITVTGTVGTASLTGCTAGNLIVVHAVLNPNADFNTYTSITNIEDLAGTDNALTEAVAGAHYQVGATALGKMSLHWGRVIANGTCSVDINVATDDAYCRIYEFTSAHTGTTYETITENVLGNPGQAAGTGVTVSASGVQSTGADRLALNFVGVVDDTTIAAFSGETGGDWAEAVGEYTSATGNQGCISLQTAALGVGTISGGTLTIGASAGFTSVAMALLPASAPPTVPTLHVMRSNLRW